ncbi:uncharacterized protein LOC115740847 [Rhodamnia argentea]|uniref:Uncharacterized protein LOC115740847 n=1 Tax=Rhodamnia argentea TaxID=178133 RepID=A0ABM3HX88_9MYRT|nr:uncharacterized protein LOC115740847 [Rhodamnia argentea]
MNLVLLHLVLTGLYLASADPTDSLDASVESSAFQTLVLRRPHTGALYKALLPANLSGMEVSVIRLRSRTLWREGTNFSGFTIPPRTLPVPRVKRLAIVYQNLGNWSSQYYSVPGIIKLGLNTSGDPISIRFHALADPRGKTSTGKCAAFYANGTVHFSTMGSAYTCYARDQGRFSIILPSETRKRKPGNCWVIGLVLGFVGMALMCYVGFVLRRMSRLKKVQVMERRADEGELFKTIWVGGSKMPSATVTRTPPVLENGGLT